MSVSEKYSNPNMKWIDVEEPSHEEMEGLSREYRLNEHTVLDCLQPEHLPKYEWDEESGIHFLILRYFVNDCKEEASTIQQMTNKIAIFCTEKFLITIHKYDSPFLDELARKKGPGNDLTTTGLLSKIVWQALETYDEPANKLSEKLDFYEDQLLLRKTGSDLSEALYYIKRHATVCQKVIMLMQEPINHINVSNHDSSNLQDVRDQHLKMQILYTQIMDETNNLLTLSTSFSSQRTNEVMRILTLFSVFFMPVTFIVGVYGMNFKYMPELQSRWGYPGVLLFMGLVSAAIFFWFKRKKWI